MREIVVDLKTGEREFYLDGELIGTMSAEERRGYTTGDIFGYVLERSGLGKTEK